MWKIREIEQVWTSADTPLRLHPVWMLLGPRQVGKSSLLRHLAPTGRTLIDLDDLATRGRANSDPVLFSQSLKLPVTIDEIQYAPQLLSQVKILADREKKPGSIWITGSQNFEVMKGVRESLAGRVAIMTLLGFSNREKGAVYRNAEEFFEGICETTFPALCGISDPAVRDVYLNGYIRTFVERDVQELLGISKRREFENFVKLCALRTGQLINFESLASDAGVAPATVKQWLSILEDSFLIKIVPPYFSNRNKRLVKTPKLYFLDAGLCAYIAGWRDPRMVAASPMAGALFENSIAQEIIRYFNNRIQSFELYFWRSRDGEEVDFIVETGGQRFAIECKVGQPQPSGLARKKHLDDLEISKGYVATLTALGAEPHQITEHWMAGPPEQMPIF